VKAIGIGIGIPFYRSNGNVIDKLISAFKARVSADSGTIEAESCLKSTLANLLSIDL